MMENTAISLMEMDEEKLKEFRKTLLDNIIRLTFMERQMALSMDGERLQEVLDKKKKSLILLESVLKNNPPQKVDLTCEEMCRFGIYSEEEIEMDLNKMSWEEKIGILKQMNRMNMRLYRSILLFIANIKSVYRDTVGGGGLYSNKGAFKLGDISLQLNRKA